MTHCAETWYTGNDALCEHVVHRKWRTVRTRGTPEMTHFCEHVVAGNTEMVAVLGDYGSFPTEWLFLFSVCDKEYYTFLS